MSIVRDDCEERLTRVDRMIDEFRKAQSRRLAKAATVKGNKPSGATAAPSPRGSRRAKYETESHSND